MRIGQAISLLLPELFVLVLFVALLWLFFSPYYRANSEVRRLTVECHRTRIAARIQASFTSSIPRKSIATKGKVALHPRVDNFRRCWPSDLGWASMAAGARKKMVTQSPCRAQLPRLESYLGDYYLDAALVPWASEGGAGHAGIGAPAKSPNDAGFTRQGSTRIPRSA